MLATRIAIIDDDPLIGEFLTTLLEPYGYWCQAFETAESFLYSNPAAQSYSCILVDWQLPGINGIDLIRQIKSWTPSPPVMMITGTQNDEDLARALHLGADDFITKPIKKTLFLARLRALLRRTGEDLSPPRVPSAWLTLHPATLQIETFKGVRLTLSRKEFLLLDALVINPEQLTTRETLLARLEGVRGNTASQRNLDLTICRLRKKLSGISGLNIEIRSIYGEGYAISFSESSSL